jgi:hypothetical protein
MLTSAVPPASTDAAASPAITSPMRLFIAPAPPLQRSGGRENARRGPLNGALSAPQAAGRIGQMPGVAFRAPTHHHAHQIPPPLTSAQAGDERSGDQASHHRP